MKLWSCMDEFLITKAYKLASVNLNESDWNSFGILHTDLGQTHWQNVKFQPRKMVLPYQWLKCSLNITEEILSPFMFLKFPQPFIPWFCYPAIRGNSSPLLKIAGVLYSCSIQQRIYPSSFKSGGLCCLCSGRILENTVNWIYQSFLIFRICDL